MIPRWLSLALPAVDEDLGVVLDRVSEDPQGASLELLLLLLFPLLRGHLLLAHSESLLFPLDISGEIVVINTNVWFRLTLSNGAEPDEFQS